MDTTQKKSPVLAVPAALGIKPANSTGHDIVRLAMILVIIYMIYNTINQDAPEEVCLGDISHVVKPGTIMYQTIAEMDSDTQRRFVSSLRGTLEESKPVSKYISSLQAALIAGVASEYIVNGNLSKPMGILAKTIMYSLLTTMNSLKK